MKNTLTSILLVQSILLFLGLYTIDRGWWQATILLALHMLVVAFIGLKTKK